MTVGKTNAQTVNALSLGYTRPLINGENYIGFTNAIAVASSSTTSVQTLNVTLNYVFNNGQTAVIGNDIYIMGGKGVNNTVSDYKNYIHKYNVTSRTLTLLNQTLSSTKAFGYSYAYGNDIYILMGSQNGNVLNSDVDKYDTSLGTFTTIATQARRYYAAATVGNNTYIFGGYTNYRSSNPYITTQILKFDKTSITTLNSSLVTRIYGGTAVAVGTNIYIFGGRYSTSSGSIEPYIYKFDTTSETLTTVNATLPTAKFVMTGCAIGTDIYLFGGQTNDANTTDDIYKFDTTTETISTLSLTLNYAIRNASCEVVDGKAYIIGGEANKIQVFTP